MSEREIVIRLRFPRRLSKPALVVAALAVVVGGAAVYAATANPLTLDNHPANSVLSSATLNGNFSAIQTAVRALQTQVASGRLVATINSKQFSVGATRYCGATPTASPFSGNIGGYGTAKAQCETACSSSSAHMCTSEELVRSVAVGITVATGWYAAGLKDADQSGTNTANNQDCRGWTSISSNDVGPLWSGTAPNTNNCGTSTNVILCCD